ncbi:MULTISPECIES: lyase family protein [Prauserella salsuginis group]|uniref:Lyase family protein n=1 Tax=Prauserella salsuginis TaxID=387889 RepID=A0ABW6G1B3_9PSEU|nr:MULTISPECIES: lyase family protein [Prauserella salsuginis group]MCR3722150.1 3-carboxy-cis,cis-muconate cycloisomerase [Prauserella flava]MCR3736148.1 3-carboxy-cis,cis-muconate cycloisomerase [Prauserella salsuginis]
MGGLLGPGTHRAAGLTGDAAVADAMRTVEIAWLRALAATGVLEATEADRAAETLSGARLDVADLSRKAEDAGNPVVPLVTALRDALGDDPLAARVHRGLTSQDTLDTALVLLIRDAFDRIGTDLDTTADQLATLAAQHRDAVMPGRTLTQYAVPVTFGLTAAQWLAGVLDARDAVRDRRDHLPVQCGGAAGTLSLVAEFGTDPVATARAFAAELTLRWPGLPWHTRRRPVTDAGDALVGVCDALGVVATDVGVLGRPEIAEVREGAAPGRGGSSTMPHKRNPVLSVLVRSAGLQAPQLGAQLHLAAAQAVDQRPDGAWHTEWPTLRRLLELTITAAAQAAELTAGLEVDTALMRTHADDAADQLLAERGGSGEPASCEPTEYLGAAGRFVDTVLARHRS